MIVGKSKKQKPIRRIRSSPILPRDKALTKDTKFFSLPELGTDRMVYFDGNIVKIKERIGFGAYSDVYRATSPISSPKNKRNKIEKEEEVAVKVLHGDQKSWFSQKNTHAEEEVLLKIPESEYIVKCFGSVTLNNTQAGFLLEYCAEGNLYDLLTRYSSDKQIISTKCLQNWVQDAIAGVNHLHSQEPPIVHRDIKSPNYLVQDNRLKLCDFGLCRRQTPFNQSTTFKRMRSTPAWAAPELFSTSASNGGYSTGSDIYSVGIVIWELLSLYLYHKYSRPFAGYNEIQTMVAIISGMCPEIKSPPFSKSLADHLESCWHQDPKQRPSCKQLLKIVQVL